MGITEDDLVVAEGLLDSVEGSLLNSVERVADSSELSFIVSSLSENSAKLTELYQSSMTLTGATVEVSSDVLADLSSKLYSDSRRLKVLLRNLEYDHELGMQRSAAVVGKTNFKTPTQWGKTSLSNDNFEEILEKVRAIQVVPLQRDFWTTQPKVAPPIKVYKSPWWEKVLHFFGYCRRPLGCNIPEDSEEVDEHVSVRRPWVK